MDEPLLNHALKRLWIGGAGLALSLACGWLGGAAVQAAAAPPTESAESAESRQPGLAAGVYTEAQANAGQAVYDNSCKNCHDARFYRDALRSWRGQPLLYLWESLLGTMPADSPGSLALEDYTNVIAFILSQQGFPAGETLLDPDAGMDKIIIEAP